MQPHEQINSLIKEYYDIILVQCPRCSSTLLKKDNDIKLYCSQCRDFYNTNDCPDLFY